MDLPDRSTCPSFGDLTFSPVPSGVKLEHQNARGKVIVFMFSSLKWIPFLWIMIVLQNSLKMGLTPRVSQEESVG